MLGVNAAAGKECEEKCYRWKQPKGEDRANTKKEENC